MSKYQFCLQFTLYKIVLFMFLEHYKNSPFLRLLHWLYMLPKTSLPQRSTCLPLSFKSLLTLSLLTELRKIMIHQSFCCTLDPCPLDSSLRNADCHYIPYIFLLLIFLLSSLLETKIQDGRYFICVFFPFSVNIQYINCFIQLVGKDQRLETSSDRRALLFIKNFPINGL